MLNKEEILKLINENPVFHLATTEGDQPRVRGMLLYRADDDGIVFHTASAKDLFKQLKANPKTELCFQNQGKQIRVTGEVVEVADEKLKEEIFNHPTRAFLRAWKDQGIFDQLRVFQLKSGTAVEWSMELNFEEKKPVQL